MESAPTLALTPKPKKYFFKLCFKFILFCTWSIVVSFLYFSPVFDRSTKSSAHKFAAPANLDFFSFQKLPRLDVG